MLTFLHISDIHFSVFEGDENHDLEAVVRNEMLDDIAEMHREVGDMDAILVVGDIANKGRADEYGIASEFLDRACDIVGCDRDRVICVPGNHDIDRSHHDAAHAAFRYQLRHIPVEEVSDVLRAALAQRRGAEVLLDPLTEYNRFALRYRCAIDAEHLTWTPKRFSLGSRDLLVYGVTSAFLCDSTDSKCHDETKLVLGEFQCGVVARERDAVAVALVHHPPSWLRDAHRTTPWLARAQLVLTGHEHEASIDDQNKHTIAIASGAVNPERTAQGWVPAYNVLQLDVEQDVLRVTAHVRSWQGGATPARAEFGRDRDVSPNPRSLTVHLHRAGLEQLESDVEPAEPEATNVEPPEPSEPIGSDDAAMIFRIMSAPPDLRQRVARELHLIDATDEGGLGLDRRILDQAVSAQLLEELDERITND